MRERGSAKILLIDDEPALLRLMKTYLERSGYSVDAYERGREGWQRFQAAAGEYGVVISDLTLPDVEMEPLLPAFARLNPAARIIVCSGRVFDREMLPEPVRHQFGVLPKPFVPKMLKEAVAEALSGSACACA